MKNSLRTHSASSGTACVRAQILACFLLGSFGMTAQGLTVPLFSDSWQSTFTNPALYGNLRGRLTIGLPGVSNDLVSENLTYNDLLSVRGDDRTLNLSQIAGLLGERNELRNDLAVETIGVGLRGDRFSIGLAHRLRANGRLDYPKTLVQVVAEGNARFIGQTVEIAPLGTVTSYHEIGLGLSYAITDNIHLGGRIKYLSGIADMRTVAGGSLGLTTGEDNFALTLEQDLTLNSSGTVNYEGIDEVSVNYDLNGLRAGEVFSGNSGLAFDLGVFADLGKFRLQAAANDLGGTITWENEVTTLDFQGTDAFSGLDILEQFFEDSVSFASALDSLEVTFAPTESNDPYDAKLAATYLLGGEYDITDRLTAGLLVVHYARPEQAETAVAVSARYRLLEQLTVGVNYNSRRYATANFGVHLYGNLGPLQLFVSTDNIATVFRAKDSTRAAFRVGSALAIGGVRKAQKARRKKE